jgi:hypothetical protein
MTKQYRVLVEGYQEFAHMGIVGNGICFEQWYDDIEDAYDRYCSYVCDLSTIYAKEWISHPVDGREFMKRSGYHKMLECWEDDECIEDMEYEAYGYAEHERDVDVDIYSNDLIVVADGHTVPAEVIYNHMIDEVRERVSMVWDSSNEQAFYDAYCVMHKHVTGETFVFADPYGQY